MHFRSGKKRKQAYAPNCKIAGELKRRVLQLRPATLVQSHRGGIVACI